MLTRLKRIYNSANTHRGFRNLFVITTWIFAEHILRMVNGNSGKLIVDSSKPDGTEQTLMDVTISKFLMACNNKS